MNITNSKIKLSISVNTLVKFYETFKLSTKITIKFTIQNNSSVSIQSINHAYSCADGSVYKVNHGGGIAPGQKHEASISISSSKLPMTFINVSDSYPSGLSGASYPTTVISTTKEVLVTAN